MKQAKTALKWHLENNIFPPLTPEAIESIERSITQLNAGEIELDTTVGRSGVSVGQMVEDLELEQFVNELE